MTKKLIIRALVIGLLSIPLTWYFKECSHRVGGFAGSYPNAEFYDVNISYRGLKQILKDYKAENPDINLPSNLHWSDSKSSYWYFFTFFDKENQRTFSTWIREDSKNITTFALLGTIYVADTTKFYNINDELSLMESYKFRKRFEELILNPVKERLKNFVPNDIEPDTIVTFQSSINKTANIKLSLLKNKTFSFYMRKIHEQTVDEQSSDFYSTGVWSKHNEWTRLTFLKNIPTLPLLFSEQFNGEICKIINDSTVDIITERLVISGISVEETNGL